MVHLPYHNERVNRSRKTILHADDSWDLSKMIILPELDRNLVYRCRIIYSLEIESVEFLPYKPRVITKLSLVYNDQIDYSFKYADRSVLDNLRKTSAGTTDSDILIVQKGMISDTSFSNIAFYDGSKWYTPSTPLLKGTKRCFYLRNKMIAERRIAIDDLHKYQHARLINSMLDLEDGGDIYIENII